MGTTTDPRPLPERLRDVVFYADRLRRFERLQREHGPRMNDRGLRLIRKATFGCHLALRDLGAVPPAWLEEDDEP